MLKVINTRGIKSFNQKYILEVQKTLRSVVKFVGLKR